MNWEDECYLLSKRKFRENANIINVFSPTRGKVGGIVYGGNSRKIRNYLQISNKLFVFNNTKNENKIGYFKTELIKPVSPNYFNDKERTSALISLCSLLNLLLPEGQPNKKIYNAFEKLIENLNLDNWIFLYIFFEVNLIKDLGYDTNISSFKIPENFNQKFIKLSIDDYYYDVPIFLIKRNTPKDADNELIRKSLVFTRSILLKKFFIPNNIIFPQSRIILERHYN